MGQQREEQPQNTGVSRELVVENEAGRMYCPYCESAQTSFNGKRKGRGRTTCAAIAVSSGGREGQ